MVREMVLKCPTCGRDVRWEDEPRGTFCSERCRVADLAKWADQTYRVPAEETPYSTFDGDGEPPPTEH